MSPLNYHINFPIKLSLRCPHYIVPLFHPWNFLPELLSLVSPAGRLPAELHHHGDLRGERDQLRLPGHQHHQLRQLRPGQVSFLLLFLGHGFESCAPIAFDLSLSVVWSDTYLKILSPCGCYLEPIDGLTWQGEQSRTDLWFDPAGRTYWWFGPADWKI